MPVKKGTKQDGRSGDLHCYWFTRLYGDDWEIWRAYADAWLHKHHASLSTRRSATTFFLERYLIGEALPSVPAEILKSNTELPSLISVLEKTRKGTNKTIINNFIVEFIDWVIAKDFSEPNDNGVLLPIVQNPFQRDENRSAPIETVHNPLPYRYIKELRSILCPKPKGHFCDWNWAMLQTGQGDRINDGDWFEVDSAQIDKSDPDCVWRERKQFPGQYRIINGKPTKLKKERSIYEMWSPVVSMALFIKLHLPLRTYQVRMLDSGEADTWRYDNRQFVLNDQYTFALGTEKTPWLRGVFRRIRSPDTGEFNTGLYINTNKTADQNKDAINRGYVIPWENLGVLYWLEKLRNWQAKYNPITQPTLWASLKKKHTGELRSQKSLKAMSSTCFLLRDASAVKNEDKAKPIQPNPVVRRWYRLLSTLEQCVVERDGPLSDGTRLRFVKGYDADVHIGARSATEFPLHSLRVSLITHYAMDGAVPLPVLSKLLAGHSRLIMTLYYIKITPIVMREKMATAEALIDSREQQQLEAFLVSAELAQIKDKAVFTDTDSIESALVNRNPAGWEVRNIGLCLAGGNTVKSDENTSMIGCWNGGKLIAKRGSANSVYSPVAHGPENCIRCRWFITDASYLDALRAHFNNLSYRAQLAVNLAVESEQAVESLEDARFNQELAGKPFTQQAELQVASRRYEKQLVEADEYAKDMRSCFTLIHRIIDIEQSRTTDDNRQKLITNGTLHDIHQPISLLETQSELFQLSDICEDAEFYPDLADELRKTPGIEKRSRTLNTALMREGYQPVFMMMDEQMQMIMGNALMRRMAQQMNPDDWRVEGVRRVSGIIEAGHSLREAGILDTGIKALEDAWQQPVLQLNELLQPTKPELEIVIDDN